MYGPDRRTLLRNIHDWRWPGSEPSSENSKDGKSELITQYINEEYRLPPLEIVDVRSSTNASIAQNVSMISSSPLYSSSYFSFIAESSSTNFATIMPFYAMALFSAYHHCHQDRWTGIIMVLSVTAAIAGAWYTAYMLEEGVICTLQLLLPMVTALALGLSSLLHWVYRLFREHDYDHVVYESVWFDEKSPLNGDRNSIW